jgi:putative membrane protein
MPLILFAKPPHMLPALIERNDRKAYWLIAIFSVLIFALVSVLGKIQVNVSADFDIHIFAKVNAFINASVAVLLIWALVAVKNGHYEVHRNVMFAAMLLSVLFLLSYVAHHLLAGEARFGDLDHNGIVSAEEKLEAGSLRIVYLLLLSTHILLAGLILPFILFTAYRALTAEWPKHKQLAKYTWPLWLYVAITGPVVYLMISPYYQ